MDVGRVLVRTGAHAVLRCADDHWRHGRAATGDESLVHSLRMATIRWIDRAWPVAFAVGCGAMLVAVYVWEPAASGLFPPCPFHAFTGLHCPGCGSLPRDAPIAAWRSVCGVSAQPADGALAAAVGVCRGVGVLAAIATAVGRRRDVAARLADGDSGCRAVVLAAAEFAVRAVFVALAPRGLAVSPEGDQKSQGVLFGASSSGPIPDIKSRNSTGGRFECYHVHKATIGDACLVW